MCTNHQSFTVKKVRHRYEMKLFFISVLLTLCAFFAAIGIAIYKDKVYQYLEADIVEDYRSEHPEAINQDNATILASMSKEDKESLHLFDELSLPVALGAPLLFILSIIWQVGKIYGTARSNGVRIDARQFPEVYALWQQMAKELGLPYTPELYIQNGSGVLNAFTTCMPGYRAFGVVYSDILERALANNDKKALQFILGHELGHIRLGHVRWWYMMFTVIGNLPGLKYVLGLPLSRAREYGCDKVGQQLSGDEHCQGLIMLAAGKHLYHQVNLAAYEAEHIHQFSYWNVIYNASIDHPAINWRIAALRYQCDGGLFLPIRPPVSKATKSL